LNLAMLRIASLQIPSRRVMHLNVSISVVLDRHLMMLVPALVSSRHRSHASSFSFFFVFL
jgi:hypothetical protein